MEVVAPQQSLFLHPVHTDAEELSKGVFGRQAGGQLPTALNFRCFGLSEQPATASRLAVEAVARAGRLWAAKAQKPSPSCQELSVGCDKVYVDTARRRLHLAASDNLGSSVQVPLLRAEVAHAEEAPCRHLIAIVSEQEAARGEVEDTAIAAAVELEVWLFVLDGDDVALLAVLDTLSTLGVIRTGLDESFVLSSSELGSGGCATVYLAQSRGAGGGPNTPVAIKLAREPGSKSDMALLHEMPLLAAAQGHSNVVQFLGLFRADDVLGRSGSQWALALELCSSGDLQDWIFKRGPQSEEFATKIQGGVLSAIAHIHERGIVHRDVKSENILLAQGGTKGVLTDFGVGALASDAVAMAVRCGSAGYVAPEVLKHDAAYDNKVDVFGMGVTLYYTLSNTLPFTGADFGQILRRNLRCNVSLESNARFRHVTALAKKFLMWLLQASPDNRPTAAAALTHEWFAQRNTTTRRPSFDESTSSSTPDRMPAAPLSTGSETEESERRRQQQLQRLRQRQQAPEDQAAVRPVPPAPRPPGAGPAPRRRLPSAPRDAPGESALSPVGGVPSIVLPGARPPGAQRAGAPSGDEDAGPPAALPRRAEAEAPGAAAAAQPAPGPAEPAAGGRRARWNCGPREATAEARRGPALLSPNFEIQGQTPGVGKHRRFRLLESIVGAANASAAAPPASDPEAAENALTLRDSRGWLSLGGMSNGSGIDTPRGSRKFSSRDSLDSDAIPRCRSGSSSFHLDHGGLRSDETSGVKGTRPQPQPARERKQLTSEDSAYMCDDDTERHSFVREAPRLNVQIPNPANPSPPAAMEDQGASTSNVECGGAEGPPAAGGCGNAAGAVQSGGNVGQGLLRVPGSARVTERTCQSVPGMSCAERAERAARSIKIASPQDSDFRLPSLAPIGATKVMGGLAQPATPREGAHSSTESVTSTEACTPTAMLVTASAPLRWQGFERRGIHNFFGSFVAGTIGLRKR